MKYKMALAFIAGIILIANSLASAQSASPIHEGDHLVQGFGHAVKGTDFWYHSAIPQINNAYLVRAIDGNQVATWETEKVPRELEGSRVQFVWMAGLGSNLGDVPMKLSVNDQQCTFSTARQNSWDIHFGDGYCLSFRNAFTDGAGDLFGFMFLAVPSKYIKAGECLTLSVTGSASNSQAWYMTFLEAIPTGLTFNAFPAIIKKGEKRYQPITAQVVYFGIPAQAHIYINGIKEKSFIMDFGIQKLTMDIEAADYPAPLTLRLESEKINEEKMINLDPVRPWQIYFVQHSHTDIGYTRPQTEVLAEHLRYIDFALDYCDATDDYPDEAKFKWTCEAAFAVDNYLQSRPVVQIERLKKRIREGRIEVTGMYFNFDETPDEQTYAASLEPIQRFSMQGIEVTAAMQDDVNGIGWCFADYFPQLGIRYLNMGTHGHRALLAFDKPTPFWWESPSGNRMLTFRAEHYMLGNTLMGIHSGNFDYFETKVMEYLIDLAAKGYQYDVIPIQHSGYQTDNSPPSTLSCEMVNMWNQKYEWPKLKTATVSEFFKYIESKESDKLPVIRGAWPDWWTDGYGSAAREVAASRQAHTDIIANQGGLAMAAWMGASLPDGVDQRIALVNQAILFYDEHTFGHAQSVREPYFEGTIEQRSLKESYAWEAFRRSRMVGEETMGLLQQYINKDEKNATLTVYNTLNWPKSGIAKVYIDHQILPMGIPFSIVTEDGKACQVQALEHRSDGTYWALWADQVPAMGYRTYTITLSEPGKTSSAGQANASVNKTNPSNHFIEMTNRWYNIKVAKDHATIVSLFDKELNLELYDQTASWGLGQFIYELLGNRSQMEAFTLTDFERFPLDSVWFESYEEGPVWNTLRFKGETAAAIGPAGFVAEIRIYNTSKLIEFVYMIRKKMVFDPEAVYIAFPFKLEQGKIWAEVQGGVMEAGIDQIPGSSNDWNTVQNFAAIRSEKAQIVISSDKIPLMQFGAINTGRYNAGATPESTSIFGWPMNNYWTTNFNAEQHGEFTFSYVITSSASTDNNFSTKFGWANRVPFLTRISLPGTSVGNITEHSLWKNQPDNLLLVNARPVHNHGTILLQLREINGETATFSQPFLAGKKELHAQETDVLGNPLANPGDPIVFRPWESKFILISK